MRLVSTAIAAHLLADAEAVRLAPVSQDLVQLSSREGEQNQAEWGFLKNIVNIDTFFASGNEHPHSSMMHQGSMDWMHMTKNTAGFHQRMPQQQV